jgi:hypothetical protein
VCVRSEMPRGSPSAWRLAPSHSDATYQKKGVSETRRRRAARMRCGRPYLPGIDPESTRHIVLRFRAFAFGFGPCYQSLTGSPTPGNDFSLFRNRVNLFLLFLEYPVSFAN